MVAGAFSNWQCGSTCESVEMHEIMQITVKAFNTCCEIAVTLCRR